MPGVVLELGLGNGRSYDHLRSLLPDREIYVFDRQVACHPSCRPEVQYLFLGEMTETLRQAAEKIRCKAVLIHLDVGSGDGTETERNVAALEPALLPLCAPGAVLVSDQPLLGLMHNKQVQPLPLPPGVATGRYFLYQAVGPDR